MIRHLPLLFILLLPTVSAAEGSIKLLALLESPTGNQTGTVTDLFLEIKPGNERVFLETFPLTKITTQISLRFAQQIACKELGASCNNKDFFYTIKASPGLVGGPSAGAAATILTAAILTHTKIDPSITITGTINSGGIIGPVGGINYKIHAAASNGIKIILIPKGTRNYKDKNTTIDLVDLGTRLNLTIIEVATFDEAFEIVTGTKIPPLHTTFTIEPDYQTIMKDVANDICQRAQNAERIINTTVINQTKADAYRNISKRADESREKKEYYSQASYCFRTNLLLKQISIASQKPTTTKILKNIKKTSDLMLNTTNHLNQQDITTISDIQTYMAVNERLEDAQESLSNALNLATKDSVQSANYQAHAEERVYSAIAWSKFFQTKTKTPTVNPTKLKQSCMHKLSEAEERYNYVKSMFPTSLQETRKQINHAYTDLTNQSYITCLHRASKAKAEADVILSVMDIEEGYLANILDLKLDMVKKQLIRSQQKKVFPIIGYSYYEYARSLKDIDRSSALLFTEYALELSNLDIYFSEAKQPLLPRTIRRDTIIAFVIGLLAGITIFYLCHKPSARKKK